jgi:hypothetical protein
MGCDAIRNDAATVKGMVIDNAIQSSNLLALSPANFDADRILHGHGDARTR